MGQIHTSTLPEQVAEHLRQEIRSRRWISELPGRDALASELGVSPRSVKSAISILTQQGLLTPQGPGRRVRIADEGYQKSNSSLRVALLNLSKACLQDNYLRELPHYLEEAGHKPFFTSKTIMDIGMKPSQMARYVEQVEADAWVVVAASREVLRWFADYEVPSFALAGLRQGIPIAATGPDKAPAFRELLHQLMAMNHRLITYVCRRQHRAPVLGTLPRILVQEFTNHGIPFGPFNLPDWQETQQGFDHLLKSLFAHTPPTALIFDERIFYHACCQFIVNRGLKVPDQVSLACTDPDPSFEWCKPSVAYISHGYRSMLQDVVDWVNKVSNGKVERTQNLIESRLICGGTVGPRR